MCSAPLRLRRMDEVGGPLLYCPNLSCPYNTRNASYFRQHIKKRHPNYCLDSPYDTMKLFRCDFCGTTFKSKESMHRHIKIQHNGSVPGGRVDCPCCEEKCSTHDELVLHYSAQHNPDARIERARFESENAFSDWLKDIEYETQACFSVRDASATSRRYRCTFAGLSLPSTSEQADAADGTPASKKQRTSRGIRHCTAFMNVKIEETGVFVVKYCKVHAHDPNPHSFRIPGSVVEQKVVEQLDLGVSKKEIVETLRAGTDDVPASIGQIITTRTISRIQDRRSRGILRKKHMREKGIMENSVPLAYIESGVRTPICSFRGSFSALSAVELGTIVAKEALARADATADIEETFAGCVLTAGAGQNVARQIALAAGISAEAQAVTVNKVCSSSLKALQMACFAIKAGYRKKCLVVGTECMSRVPFYVPRGDIPYGGLHLADGVAKDGLEDAMLKKPMGLCAEKSAEDFDISRARSDNYAIDSYTKARVAWETSLFAEEVMPVPVTPKRGDPFVVKDDDEYKKLDRVRVLKLAPVFKKEGGTITAANASTLNDGAVAAVITAHPPKNGPCAAEILMFAEAGLDPVEFTAAPVNAVKKLLAEAKLTTDNIALWEVNEAFATTALIFIQALSLNPKTVNVKGGAVALGHPLGMSGLRIVVSLAYSLKPGELGVAAICNGGGEAMAVLIRKR